MALKKTSERKASQALRDATHRKEREVDKVHWPRRQGHTTCPGRRLCAIGVFFIQDDHLLVRMFLVKYSRSMVLQCKNNCRQRGTNQGGF